VAVLLGQLAIAMVLLTYLHRKLSVIAPTLLRRLWVVLPPLLSLGAICPFLQLIAQQPSLNRFLVFWAPLQIVLFVSLLLACIAVVVSWCRNCHSITLRVGTIVTVIFSLAGLYGAVFNWTPKLPHQIAATRAFFGVTSLQPLFGHWREEWQVVEFLDPLLPKDACILPLQFAPYSYMYDSTRYARPMENERLHELPTMLGADPAAAAEAYVRSGIRYFLVKLPPTDSVYDSLGYAVSSALFEPAHLKEHFRVVALPNDNWLLVLHGTDADGILPSAAFLSAYEHRRRIDAGQAPNWMMDSLLRARLTVPELALPARQPAP